MSSPPPSGPPPPGPPPPGHPSPAPNRNRLYWILGGIGALVVIAIAVFVVVLGKGGASTPRASAETLIAAAEAKDANAARPLVCAALQSEFSGSGFDEGDAPNAKYQASIKGITQISDTEAEIRVDSVLTGLPGGGTAANTHIWQLTKEDGVWKYCGDRPG